MFKKKLLVLLMMSLSGAAFASFNPFDVFNASNNTQQNASDVSQVDQGAPSQNATSAASAPQSAASKKASGASASPYVRTSPLVAPATAKNAQLVSPATQRPVAPANPLTSKGAANSTAVPTNAGQSSPVNHVTPYTVAQPNTSMPPNILVPGSIVNSSNNSQPGVVGGDNILKVLNTINNNMVTWKTQSDQNKIASGAQLVPTTTQNLQGFLLNQSGLSSFLNVPLIMNQALSAQKRAVYNALQNNDYGSGSKNTSGTLLLLTPFSKNDMPQSLSQSQSSSTSSNLDFPKFSGPYAASYVDGLMALTPNLNASASGLQLFDLVNYAISQIAFQTKLVASGSDSLMATLQSAVNAPFITQAQSNGAPTWLQQLQTASSPQLLRTIAILLAEANQMHYIQLQNQQIMVVLQTAQVVEAASENQKLTKLVQGQAQTNALLLKMYQQMLVQNSKK